MAEAAILKVADRWKNRVFLVVADGGPCRVPVDQVLENPSRLYRRRQVGCAVYLGQDRLLLTTASVLGVGPDVAVFDERGNQVLARLVGRDELLDLALLEAVEDLPGTAGLPPLEVADQPEEGAACMVLGNAYGRSLSATLGRIAAMEEIMPAGLPLRAIRVRAPIYPGDSGAPVLDHEGRFVGLLTAVVDGETGDDAILGGDVGQPEIEGRHRRPAGMAGYALPAAQVRQAWNDLLEHGRVRRGYLGVRMSLADDMSGVGATILGVLPDSPAEHVGIRPGDLVIGFGDRRVTGPKQFCALVAATPPSARLELRLLRDQVEHMITVEIGEAVRPPGLQPVESRIELGERR
jgi:S1-C subfamily serine protease